MLGHGLSQLQKALNGKADSIQKEFITISDRLNTIARTTAEAESDEKKALAEEQEALHERRAAVAEEINVWRDRAKDLMNRTGDEALRANLTELAEAAKDDEAILEAIKFVKFILDASEEELLALSQPKADARPVTPAGRLMERARKEWDLRQDDPAPRHKAAIEFANRQGMAQDEQAIAEVEEAIYDPDQFVREAALMTTIELHRYRALRLADLDAAHQSVERLAQLNHPAAVPALINVLENPRTGFVRQEGAGEPMVTNNSRLRVAALKRLIEWHTSGARRCVEAHQLDRDENVSYLARRALETFPGEWKGPIRGTGLLSM